MIIRCGFCGGEYDPELAGAGGCAGCVMHGQHGGCSMSKCPACGYDNPLPPKWLDRLTSIFRKKKPVEAPKNKGCGGGCGSCGDSGTTLADLKSGESGVVDCLKTSDADALDKMMAMSVYPGMRLSVIQASPSCVFQIGRSRFAVDKELAAVVGIKKD